MRKSAAALDTSLAGLVRFTFALLLMCVQCKLQKKRKSKCIHWLPLYSARARGRTESMSGPTDMPPPVVAPPPRATSGQTAVLSEDSSSFRFTGSYRAKEPVDVVPPTTTTTRWIFSPQALELSEKFCSSCVITSRHICLGKGFLVPNDSVRFQEVKTFWNVLKQLMSITNNDSFSIVSWKQKETTAQLSVPFVNIFLHCMVLEHSRERWWGLITPSVVTTHSFKMNQRCASGLLWCLLKKRNCESNPKITSRPKCLLTFSLLIRFQEIAQMGVYARAIFFSLTSYMLPTFCCQSLL